MIQLFVEGQPVDINEGFSTLITYAIDDVKDFGAKNTAFSKTVILPGTKRNNKLFGNIFDVSGDNTYDPVKPNYGINFNAAVTASAYIFCDNIQVLKGVVRILEVINDNDLIEYECFITGELGGFAAKLGNSKLEDLDFSAYDHPYTIPNILVTWDTANAGEGYYYPLIDYGTYGADKHDWIYKTLRPAFYVKEFIDKIFSGSGYSYDCDLFSTDRFKRLIVPNNRKAIYTASQNLVTANGANPSTFLYTGSIIHSDDIGFSSASLAASFSTPDNKMFFYNGIPSIQVEVRFNISGAYRGNTDYWIHLYQNLISIQSQVIPASPAVLSPYDLSFSVLLTLNTGDYFTMAGIMDLDAAMSMEIILDADFSIISAANELVEIILGDTVEMNTNLPKNILQKDFFSSIAKLFNLYVYEDPLNEKVLKIKPFIDFHTDATTVDWSLKLDRSKPIRIKPMSELNARYYEFVFKDDSDFWNDLYKKRYNQSYGSLIYDSEYEFVKESEKIELIFSGTPLVGFSGEDKIYSTIYKRNNTTEETIDSNIRILQARKMTGVSSWTILDADGVTVLSTQTAYGYAGHFDDPDAPANDIQFGVPKELFFTLVTGAINVNQFNVYWSSYMAEITDKNSRLLTGTFKLNYKDIYNLDFSQFIYVDGNLYRLNKIIDFNATNEDTCKVELLKVINKTY